MMTHDPTPAASEAVRAPDPHDAIAAALEGMYRNVSGVWPRHAASDFAELLRDQGCHVVAIPSPDEPPAAPADLAALKNRIDNRLNNHLCDMKEGWDDSVSGFNDAWDIVRAVFAEAALAASAAGADVRAFEVDCIANRVGFAAGAEEMREVAAKTAHLGCLVPPDGGSPTQAEIDLCDEIERRIRALPLPSRAATTEAGT